jgi:3-hydroxyisobutyrate dehydrogenase
MMSEDDAIRSTIELYFEGHAKGNANCMRHAFLPTARIEGFRGDQFLAWTLNEYCAIFTGQPALDEALRHRAIDQIDVTGSSAMAKATLNHVTVIFVDYFVLLKIGGAWRIANKTFHGTPMSA